MKKTLKFVGLLALGSVLTFTSCKSGGDSGKPGATSSEKAIEALENGKFEMKSGIINYRYDMMGMNGKQIVTFDDYGKKMLTEIVMSMMGKEIKSHSLLKDGYMYTWQDGDSKGMKMAITPEQDVNFRNLSDSIKKAMSIEKVGSEQILGKSTDVYSMKMKDMGALGKVYIWKGLTLRTDVEAQGMKMNIVAEDLKENADVSAASFELPAGITFN